MEVFTVYGVAYLISACIVKENDIEVDCIRKYSKVHVLVADEL